MNEILNDLELIDSCKRLSSLEMLGKLTKGNIRGLDKISVQTFLKNKKMKDDIFNVLIVYFFNEYSNTVYDRTAFAKIYFYWLRSGVNTFQKALEMTKLDIYLLGKNNGKS
ncbi:hypothetical protein [Heyndrickxia acidicola]|uniref:Uncharacterized protein n=1 Tax=Heyndrickxia acidicola TaxID=209389 RepID=A0ABU6MMW3_9BACI|nr:hypothetical protein [Heyndrickxia acidicola]MED1205732.1 hypothetical protein [Heyndrickxia acidicola]